MCTEILLQPEDRELSTGGDVAEFLGLTPEQVTRYLPGGAGKACLCAADLDGLAELAGRERVRGSVEYVFGEIWRLSPRGGDVQTTSPYTRGEFISREYARLVDITRERSPQEHQLALEVAHERAAAAERAGAVWFQSLLPGPHGPWRVDAAARGPGRSRGCCR